VPVDLPTRGKGIGRVVLISGGLLHDFILSVDEKMRLHVMAAQSFPTEEIITNESKKGKYNPQLNQVG
jgi:hypothetical protein